MYDSSFTFINLRFPAAIFSTSNSYLLHLYDPTSTVIINFTNHFKQLHISNSWYISSFNNISFHWAFNCFTGPLTSCGRIICKFLTTIRPVLNKLRRTWRHRVTKRKKMAGWTYCVNLWIESSLLYIGRTLIHGFLRLNSSYMDTWFINSLD